MAEVRVRRGRWEDRAAVTLLVDAMGGHDGAGDRPGTAVAFAQALESPTVRALVAELRDDVVGYLELHRRPSILHGATQGWLAALAVAPAARRRGVATALLSVAEQEAVGLGCDEIALESTDARADAHAFYRAAGFAEVAPAARFRRRVAVEPGDALEERFLSAARTAVTAVAGALGARADHAGPFDPDDKALDLECEDAAVRALEPLGLAILSEESGLIGTRPGPGEPWISLDPLDGTRNCLEGYAPWATSIGLVAGGRPLAGLVVDHSTGRRWWASPRSGARVDGRPARPRAGGLVVGPSIAPDAMVVPRVPADLQRLRIAGATAIDVCRVADGSAGAFLDVHRGIARVHDLAAAIGVLAAAGGAALGADGGPVELLFDLHRHYRLVAAPNRGAAEAILAAALSEPAPAVPAVDAKEVLP